MIGYHGAILAAGLLLTAMTGVMVQSREAAQGQPATVPAGDPPAVAFTTDILPILTKAGCNSGACHGAAIGQGGFRLSLLGYDPQQDYLAITREQAGRRIDLASPRDSLLLRKPDRSLPHKGGLKLDDDSADHAALATWIAAGAPYGPADLQVAAVQVAPDEVVLPAVGKTVELSVKARLSDGRTIDATRHALYTPNDSAVADVSDAGLITLKRRGVTSIMVRFGGQVAAVRVAVPMRDEPLPDVDPAFVPRNEIDRAVYLELQRLGIPPSPAADDAVFLRRVCLDLTGRLPTPAEARIFLARPSTRESREALIDDLLARPEMADLWTMRLGQLLQVDSVRVGGGPSLVYYRWLHEQVRNNRPFDQVVHELLTAHGDGMIVGPVNFHRLKDDPRDMAELVAGKLLGVRLACARCHAHPFAAWTQDDYCGFAALFARTAQSGTRVTLSKRGELLHPKTALPVTPRLLGATSPVRDDASDRRASLAAWMTSRENPMLARVTVNRVWRHMTGRGVVEPVDDLRPTNPPSSPMLLDTLTNLFIASGYDLRYLIRTIACSRTYQASSIATDGNRADDKMFARAYVRPLPPELLLDAISQVTRLPAFFDGTRAVQLIGSSRSSTTLEVLRGCTREKGCDDDGGAESGGVAGVLHLINGPKLNASLRDAVDDRLLEALPDDGQLVVEFYLRALSRYPTEQEKLYCVKQLQNASNRQEAAVDLLWAIVNTREFAFNH